MRVGAVAEGLAEPVDTGSGRNRAGWVFGAVTVVPALLAMAWLLPGLPLLLAHRFDALPMLLIFVPLAAVLCYFALRRLPSGWPATAGQSAGRAAGQSAGRAAGQSAGRSGGMPWWAVAGTVAVAVIFAAWQVWMRTEQIIIIRDPGTYLQVGYWIAHHGSLPIPQSLGAFGDAKGLSFASMAYFPRGTGIVPQFMTGYPMVVAAAVWLGGLSAAMVLTPLVGGCAILSFGGLAGRLAGPRWAPVAAAVLALSLPQQYTSRTTFSEPLAEVLLFGGLSLLTDSLIIGETGKADRILAGLAGLALGLTILVRLDGLSDILPVVPFLGILIAARRRQAIPFGAGAVVGVAYGLLDGYLLSRPYLDLEEPSLHPLALIAVAVVLLTVVAALVSRSDRIRQALVKRRPALTRLPDVAAVLVVLMFVAFAVRPLVQTVAGETDPISIAYVAELQKLAHLPIDGKQQYYQDSLYWVIWYIGVPAVLLGAVGLALLARRSVHALLTWRDPDQAIRVWALPLMIAIWVIATVLWRPAVSPDQPWASRRLVPFVLPGIILGAIWACAWLKERAGTGRYVPAATAWCCVAALVIPTVWTTFGISLTPRPTAHGMAFKRIGAGELGAVHGLCTAIGGDASVLILDQITGDRFAQVIRGQCDTPAAILLSPTPDVLGQAVSAIARTGRHPVLLGEYATEFGPGADPKEIVSLLTTQEAHELTTAPTRTWRIHYTVWMTRP